MNDQNPIRWRDPGSDVADGLRDIMGSAALDEAGPDRLARFASRMDSVVGAAPAASPAGSSLLSGKAMAGLLAMVGGAAIVWMLLGPEPAPEAAQAGRAPPILADADLPTPRSVAAHHAPAAPAPDEPHTVTAPAQVDSEPENARLSTVHPGSEADSLAREVKLLHNVREILRGDPAGALRLAEQHRSRFPRGILTQEREALAIEALLNQGRRDEARARAGRFIRQYPRSSHLDRLTELGDNPD